jgi:hypothetical protein
VASVQSGGRPASSARTACGVRTNAEVGTEAELGDIRCADHLAGCDTTSASHVSDLPDGRALEGRQERRDEWQQVALPVGPRMELDDRDTRDGDILLVRQVAIDGDEHAEVRIDHEAQQVAIAASGPSLAGGRGYLVPQQLAPEPPGHAFVEEHAHVGVFRRR